MFYFHIACVFLHSNMSLNIYFPILYQHSYSIFLLGLTLSFVSVGTTRNGGEGARDSGTRPDYRGED